MDDGRQDEERPDRLPFLDRPAARIVAAGCFVLAVAALGYLHRDAFLPERREAADPMSRCVAARNAEIDGMAEEGLITPARAALFKERVAGACRAQTGAGGPGS